MATGTAPAREPAPPRPNAWLQPKYLLFALIGVAFFYVMWIDERFFLDSQDPAWKHFGPLKLWLFPHALAAACGLLLGPFQFSERLRKRYAKLHRVMGRFYVAGVFIGAPLGTYIQHLNERTGDPRSFTIAAAFQALIWMLTTGVAFAMILRGKVQAHKIWMTRSFACALIFVEVRVIGGLTGWGEHFAETVV